MITQSKGRFFKKIDFLKKAVIISYIIGIINFILLMSTVIKWLGIELLGLRMTLCVNTVRFRDTIIVLFIVWILEALKNIFEEMEKIV